MHWNDESSFPTKEMLSILSDDIIFRKGSALLRFDEYSIVFAVLPEHYDYLCDKINEIGYRIAKKYKKLPVMKMCIRDSMYPLQVQVSSTANQSDL